jgi:hypothetical protein
MPDRTLREGLRNSEIVGGLSDQGFRFYILLVTFHEDYGRFDARPALLKPNLFPFRLDKTRESDISRWLTECETAGLIALYAVDSKPFGVVFKTVKPRAKRPRAPEPPAGIECWRATENGPLFTKTRVGEDSCAQMQADARNGEHKSPVFDSVLRSSNSVSPAARGVKKRPGKFSDRVEAIS